MAAASRKYAMHRRKKKDECGFSSIKTECTRLQPSFLRRSNKNADFSAPPPPPGCGVVSRIFRRCFCCVCERKRKKYCRELKGLEEGDGVRSVTRAVETEVTENACVAEDVVHVRSSLRELWSRSHHSESSTTFNTISSGSGSIRSDTDQPDIKRTSNSTRFRSPKHSHSEEVNKPNCVTLNGIQFFLVPARTLSNSLFPIKNKQKLCAPDEIKLREDTYKTCADALAKKVGSLPETADTIVDVTKKQTKKSNKPAKIAFKKHQTNKFWQQARRPNKYKRLFVKALKNGAPSEGLDASVGTERFPSFINLSEEDLEKNAEVNFLPLTRIEEEAHEAADDKTFQTRSACASYMEITSSGAQRKRTMGEILQSENSRIPILVDKTSRKTEVRREWTCSKIPVFTGKRKCDEGKRNLRVVTNKSPPPRNYCGLNVIGGECCSYGNVNFLYRYANDRINRSPRMSVSAESASTYGSTDEQPSKTNLITYLPRYDGDGDGDSPSSIFHPEDDSSSMFGSLICDLCELEMSDSHVSLDFDDCDSQADVWKRRNFVNSLMYDYTTEPVKRQKQFEVYYFTFEQTGVNTTATQTEEPQQKTAIMSSYLCGMVVGAGNGTFGVRSPDEDRHIPQITNIEEDDPIKEECSEGRSNALEETDEDVKEMTDSASDLRELEQLLWKGMHRTGDPDTRCSSFIHVPASKACKNKSSLTMYSEHEKTLKSRIPRPLALTCGDGYITNGAWGDCHSVSVQSFTDNGLCTRTEFREIFSKGTAKKRILRPPKFAPPLKPDYATHDREILDTFTRLHEKPADEKHNRDPRPNLPRAHQNAITRFFRNRPDHLEGPPTSLLPPKTKRKWTTQIPVRKRNNPTKSVGDAPPSENPPAPPKEETRSDEKGTSTREKRCPGRCANPRDACNQTGGRRRNARSGTRRGRGKGASVREERAHGSRSPRTKRTRKTSGTSSEESYRSCDEKSEEEEEELSVSLKKSGSVQTTISCKDVKSSPNNNKAQKTHQMSVTQAEDGFELRIGDITVSFGGKDNKGVCVLNADGAENVIGGTGGLKLQIGERNNLIFNIPSVKNTGFSESVGIQNVSETKDSSVGPESARTMIETACMSGDSRQNLRKTNHQDLFSITERREEKVFRMSAETSKTVHKIQSLDPSRILSIVSTMESGSAFRGSKTVSYENVDECTSAHTSADNRLGSNFFIIVPYKKGRQSKTDEPPPPPPPPPVSVGNVAIATHSEQATQVERGDNFYETDLLNKLSGLQSSYKGGLYNRMPIFEYMSYSTYESVPFQFGEYSTDYSWSEERAGSEVETTHFPRSVSEPAAVLYDCSCSSHTMLREIYVGRNANCFDAASSTQTVEEEVKLQCAQHGVFREYSWDETTTSAEQEVENGAVVESKRFNFSSRTTPEKNS